MGELVVGGWATTPRRAEFVVLFWAGEDFFLFLPAVYAEAQEPSREEEEEEDVK